MFSFLMDYASGREENFKTIQKWEIFYRKIKIQGGWSYKDYIFSKGDVDI